MNANVAKRTLTFTRPPERVVSLVPSMTESLFDLGLGSRLIGITDFCIYPAAGVANIQRVGGVKNPDVARILALKPDLVIANQEENTPEIVQALETQGIKVWVNFPKTIRQSMDVLWLLVAIFSAHDAARRLDTLEHSLDWVRATSSDQANWSYFCPIWQQSDDAGDWWMTFNQDTYMSDLLGHLGGMNCFASRHRRYPLLADLGFAAEEPALDRDIRYPRLNKAEIVAANPEVIILPSEPFPYQEKDIQLLSGIFEQTRAGQHQQIYTIDGSLLTWHGTRLGKALLNLPDQLHLNISDSFS